MEMFVKQYGLVVIYAITGILIIGILYGAFRENWKEVGSVEDGVKTEFNNNKKLKPILIVENQKVKLGEIVKDVRTFARALDIDKKEIETEKIKVTEMEGQILNDNLSLKTSKPAKAVLAYRVTGGNNETAVEYITILVD